MHALVRGAVQSRLVVVRLDHLPIHRGACQVVAHWITVCWLLLLQALEIFGFLTKLGGRDGARRILIVLKLLQLLPILQVVRLHRGTDGYARLRLLLPGVRAILIVNQRS